MSAGSSETLEVKVEDANPKPDVKLEPEVKVKVEADVKHEDSDPAMRDKQHGPIGPQEAMKPTLQNLEKICDTHGGPEQDLPSMIAQSCSQVKLDKFVEWLKRLPLHGLTRPM